MTPLDAIAKWEELGRAGLTVSIVYGNARGEGLIWSVDVLNNQTFESFPRPFGANSLEHAVEIAEIECRARGWLTAGSVQ